MNSETVLNLLSASMGVLVSSVAGILRSKILADKVNNYWSYLFYLFVLFGIIILFLGIANYDDKYMVHKKPWPLILLIVVGVFSVILAIVTFKYLNFKNYYKTNELNKIINKFTQNADKTNLMLFGGDFSFLEKGHTIDEDIQYRFLIDNGFKELKILCEEPSDQDMKTKRRYGKILRDFPGTIIKYYDPKKADLKIRGRIKTESGVRKMLIYIKHGSKGYRLIETDVSNNTGALYENIWQLCWGEIGKELTSDQKTELESMT